MGLIGDWLKSKNMKDPVRGTLQVTASTYPPDSATSGNFSLNGVVSADGLPPTAVEHAGIARTRKWPHSGMVLPVTVDRADPTRIDIAWDEVPDSWDTARQNAESMAASLRGEGTGRAGDAIPADVRGLLDNLGIEIPAGAQVHVTHSSIGGPLPGGGADEDPATRLRTLQELKASGLITDAEYEAKRAEVLGDL